MCLALECVYTSQVYSCLLVFQFETYFALLDTVHIRIFTVLSANNSGSSTIDIIFFTIFLRLFVQLVWLKSSIWSVLYIYIYICLTLFLEHIYR